MGKQENGPDLQDCEAMMRAMGALHSGSVELNVQPLGPGLNGGVATILTMKFDVLPGSQLPAAIVCESQWPCRECKTFWGHVFAGLNSLDREVGLVYEQSELWQ